MIDFNNTHEVVKYLNTFKVGQRVGISEDDEGVDDSNPNLIGTVLRMGKTEYGEDCLIVDFEGSEVVVPVERILPLI